MSDIPSKPGVYVLTHTITGDTYIGATTNLRRRRVTHRSAMRTFHHNEGIRKLVNQHGPDSFRFEVIELCEGTHVFLREAEHIERLSPSLNLAAPLSTRVAIIRPRLGIRLPVSMPIESFRQLRNLFIESGTKSMEEFAGELLAKAVARAEAELGKPAKDKPRAK